MHSHVKLGIHHVRVLRRSGIGQLSPPRFVQVEPDPACLPAAHGLACDIAGYAEDPRRDAIFVPQRLQSPEGPYKGLLCQVFGEGPISNQSEDEAEYRPAETLKRESESVCIACTKPLRERFCLISAVVVGHVQGLNANPAHLVALKSSIGFQSG
jgi:hypothetical protein